MYTSHDYQTKKALKQAVANGEKVTFYQPGPFGGGEPLEGSITLEGPHYPKPHRWYAQAEVKGGFIVSVK